MDDVPNALLKPSRRLRMAAEAARHGMGKSHPYMAAEGAATIRAPESSFPSARRPPLLRRMLPQPTGQSCVCTAGGLTKRFAHPNAAA